MKEQDLIETIEMLDSWFAGKLKALDDTAESIKDRQELTLQINDNMTIPLKTPEEVRAYRIGLMTARGSLGEFPVEIKRGSDHEN